MLSRTPTQTQEYEYYQSSSAQNERTNESEMSGERGNSQKGSYEKAQAKNDTPEKVAYFCVPCPHLRSPCPILLQHKHGIYVRGDDHLLRGELGGRRLLGGHVGAHHGAHGHGLDHSDLFRGIH